MKTRKILTIVTFLAFGYYWLFTNNVAEMVGFGFLTTINLILQSEETK